MITITSMMEKACLLSDSRNISIGLKKAESVDIDLVLDGAAAIREDDFKRHAITGSGTDVCLGLWRLKTQAYIIRMARSVAIRKDNVLDPDSARQIYLLIQLGGVKEMIGSQIRETEVRALFAASLIEKDAPAAAGIRGAEFLEIQGMALHLPGFAKHAVSCHIYAAACTDATIAEEYHGVDRHQDSNHYGYLDYGECLIVSL